MKAYPPYHVDPRSSGRSAAPEAPSGYSPPSDETLKRYVNKYWESFREIAEEYFGAFVDSLPLYSNHPYESTVVRLGANGVIIGHRPAGEASVEVMRTSDFTPPLEDLNVFTIQKRINATLLSFDFRYSSFSEEEAYLAGGRTAFEQALAVFWQALDPADFEGLCSELLEAEDIRLVQQEVEDHGLDFLGKVFLEEPAGFVREEAWGFEFKHGAAERPSAAALRQLKELAEREDAGFDALCLLTPNDLTSIGRNVAVDSAKIRVWDRTILNMLLHRHTDVMKRYFEPYAEAVERSSQDFDKTKVEEFKANLDACPSGQTAFRQYEDIGVELLRYIFEDRLGEPQVQERTSDGVERRDAITRNNRVTRFFVRIAERFDGDFIIWDFKNYEEPIGAPVVREVASYANPGLGKAVVIVSRKGGGPTAREAQLRELRNDRRVVLILSDEHLLEMAARKESGDAPEDVLEDLLDELLLAF